MMHQTILLAAVLSFIPSLSEAIIWEHNYSRGLQKGQDSGRPIMIDFYTEWCGWCKKLDQEVYPNPKVRSIADQFICIKIDCEKDNSTPNQFGIHGYPTVIFLTPQGEIIRKISGYINADKMSNYMQEALKKVGPAKKTNITNSARPQYSGNAVTRAAQLYKLGIKMEQYERLPQAKRYYEKVLDLVPQSTLARKTKKRLQIINRSMDGT